MLLSKLFLKTLKEIPKEAKIKSHQLMIQAGFIRQVASGLYSYLPLAIKILNKIIQIIREEINKTGALEILVPLLVPKEYLKISGRDKIFSNYMMKISDRYNKEYALGPTHEENFSELVAKEIHSYKDLPINLYQISYKFRDEMRPRFGLLRTREFLMKDSYSYHSSEESLNQTYKIMKKSYIKIFKRCGLNPIIVNADPGSMGGSVSEEFIVKNNIGEDIIIQCSKCDYRANQENAKSLNKTEFKNLENNKNKNSIYSKNEISELSQLNNSDKEIVKEVIYKIKSKHFVKILIKNNLYLNETKIIKALQVNQIFLPNKKELEELINLEITSKNSKKIPKKIIISLLLDKSIKLIENGLIKTNTNENKFINIKKDFKFNEFHDLQLVKEGSLCENCQSPLIEYKGIELGHIFKLGKKYTIAHKINFIDNNGKKQIPTMGCYGIGINRILAVIIEQYHDKDGIIWPINLAPYQVVVLPINMENEEEKSVAEKIYKELLNKKIEALLDDRNLRISHKFKDLDLIGIPIRINIGSKALLKNCVELKLRNKKEIELIHKEKIIEKIIQIISKN